MRFLFGVAVGAALILGGAFAHDTGLIRFGPTQPFVNWTAVFGVIGR
jgi:hypothetical protein